MRSAPCAWAPSHTLHAMPPRITRNSHRPRASDRTMVDLEHQFGLPLFRTRWHRHHPRRKLMSMGNRPSFSREAQLQWAGSRETNLASGRGRTFFLTSLFIELIDPSQSGWLRAKCANKRRMLGLRLFTPVVDLTPISELVGRLALTVLTPVWPEVPRPRGRASAPSPSRDHF